jgi:hypothetical protein
MFQLGKLTPSKLAQEAQLPWLKTTVYPAITVAILVIYLGTAQNARY